MQKRKLDFSILLPEEIDQKVVVLVKKMRESGVVINYIVTIAVATRIIMANDRIYSNRRGSRYIKSGLGDFKSELVNFTKKIFIHIKKFLYISKKFYAHQKNFIHIKKTNL